MKKVKVMAVRSTVALSSGCYSDYSVQGFAKVLKPIDAEVWERMRDDCTSTGEYPRFDAYVAVPWLIKNGYLEEIEYTELHLGEYGDCRSWAEA